MDPLFPTKTDGSRWRPVCLSVACLSKITVVLHVRRDDGLTHSLTDRLTDGVVVRLCTCVAD